MYSNAKFCQSIGFDLSVSPSPRTLPRRHTLTFNCKMAANQNFQGRSCSAIEAVWPQNETITHGILQYLNLRDVWNMRKTNSTMNVLLQGHSRPLNPNTTLNFLGAGCDDRRRPPANPPLDIDYFASPVWCTNGPRQDVLVKYCEETHAHRNRQGGGFNVCQDCLDHNDHWRGRKEYTTIQNMRVPVCKKCQDEEQNAAPDGRDTCVCKAAMRGEWKCDGCWNILHDEISLKGSGRITRLPFYHRDQDGNIKLGIRRPYYELGCRCGRTISGDQVYAWAVEWCAGCEGVIVAPSRKPSNPPQ